VTVYFFSAKLFRLLVACEKGVPITGIQSTEAGLLNAFPHKIVIRAGFFSDVMHMKSTYRNLMNV
jgi:hypothetical protein